MSYSQGGFVREWGRYTYRWWRLREDQETSGTRWYWELFRDGTRINGGACEDARGAAERASRAIRSDVETRARNDNP